MNKQRTLFALEAFLLALPAVAFLGLTFPETYRLTSVMLLLRSTSNPEISLLQTFSGLAYWGAGVIAVGVLGWLVVTTVRGQPFRFGIVFWLASALGAALTASMFGPFGPLLAVAISGPLVILAAHCAVLQSKDRKVVKLHSAA